VYFHENERRGEFLLLEAELGDDAVKSLLNVWSLFLLVEVGLLHQGIVGYVPVSLEGR